MSELLQKFESFQQSAEAAIAAHKAEIEAMRSEWKQQGDAFVKAGADAEEVKKLVDRALKRYDEMEEGRKLVERALKRYEEIEARLQMPFSTNGYGDHKTLGELVVSSDAVKELSKQVRGTGWVRGKAATIPLKSFFVDGLEQKTTITSSAVGSSTPGILVPQRIPGVIKPGVRAMRVRDLMPRFPTTQNTIEFVKENVFTNAASPTAETISKPESALTFSIDSAPVRTVACWIPAAKQVLDDFQVLQGYVDQRLIEGLKDVEDYELVAGDGTGQHLSGLSTEATAYDTARNVAGDTRLDKLNHAISQIEDQNLAADGIILHPRDWRAIQLIKSEPGGANTGEYLLGGPASLTEAMVWGLPVATTTAVTPGTFYVGGFQRHCAVWDRMEARVDISTEHSDYFIRNMVAILAEERLAFTVTLAKAVIYGTF